jgi:hypothetical protein
MNIHLKSEGQVCKTDLVMGWGQVGGGMERMNIVDILYIFV